jgi:hypothetical protein
MRVLRSCGRGVGACSSVLPASLLAVAVGVFLVAVGCASADEAHDSATTTDVALRALRETSVCHRTASSSNPYVRISVSVDAVPAHMGHGDFLWNAGVVDENCQLLPKCGDSPENAGHSCRSIQEACGMPDGSYWINPAGAENGAFRVYCQRGWSLLAKLGENASPTSDFAGDLETGNLADGNPPSSNEYAHWNAARFNAYGDNWTVRSDTDAFNNQTHFQFAFYTPIANVGCLPGVAGANWKDTTTHALLEHLTKSSTTGLTNTTWLPVPDCLGGHCESSVLGWTYTHQLDSGDNGACLDDDGQTRICHSVQGAIATLGSPSGNGSMTAAFGVGDGVAHSWAKRATYWITDVRSAATP